MSGSLGNKQIMASNIRRHLDELGLNVKDFANVMNFKYTTVLDWVNAKTYPRIDKIELMANFFKVEKSDLVELYIPKEKISTAKSIDSGASLSDKVIYLDQNLIEPRRSTWINHGEQLLDEQTSEEANEASETVQLYSYDYYDQPASAGTGQYLNDVQVEQVKLPVNVDADFVIPIYGDSMEPDYRSGDYVFVKLSVDLSDGDTGVFEYYGDAYIKELIINENEAFLHSLNPKYKDIPIDASSDFRIIGEVVGIYREE
ncbi:XRE family transcriptional regulator [Streptococcus ferus]|uniref:LexA family transcriptional regulator n=1 Tax=Streptococcus ferus TaxID=1345 RepID=UPI003514C143